MALVRSVLALAAIASLVGCGREPVGGTYRDAMNPGIRYEFGQDGTWSAESIVEVPAGVFPHGAGRRLAGIFTRSGDTLELVCSSATRQDPISGEFREEENDASSFSHRLLAEQGSLFPLGPNGERDSLFATDLNPLGARNLVPEKQP